ncbi:5'-methylthioadenosine/S-adenosylhomocysteine nucleosidase [Schaalia sp. Marseille-Q2122]|uniref:5'-methylthioadenosine/S-adenosylhomocysteine nucleosidase n=1 Tax=Schaalia sp. Marseille-Q2122 TaxID=2736604 RepID=UPI00158DD55E|nr:5'-methylthioadenosine/S-adenosylhomocysteine nucleosidase [Schaalia sp. Marseille-Q2122]
MLTLPALPERTAVDAVIQCAMDMEAAPFMEALTPVGGASEVQILRVGDEDLHQQTFALGTLAGKSVLVVTSGIGLVNAANATSRALSLVDPELFIAAGTIGGLHVDINVGEITGGTTAIYNDADVTVFGYEMGQIPRMPVDYRTHPTTIAKLDHLREVSPHPVMIGRIVSGDSFASEQVVPGIRQRFPDAIGTDMETVASAQVCYGMGVDWVCLRAVSDLCGAGSDEAFHMNGEDAARHSYDAVVAFLGI